jgi:uncharacterized OsmC-like protein
MSEDRIRQAVESATRYLGEHPEEARATDSLATATIVDGLVVRVTGPNGETLETDMVPSVGGTASAPSPGWLLRAAVASCVATLIAMRAAQLGVRLTTLEVTVDSESDDRGILGLDDAVPAGPLTARLNVRIAGAADDTLRELADWGISHCPVHDALERAIPVTREIVIA